MSDERLRNLGDKARMPRGASITEEDRSRDEPREVSDDLRIEAFRARHFQHVLPDLPPITGYSTIWVSTDNPTDIQQRQADGYEFVSPADIPGWNFPGVTEAGAPGTVNVREMRAMKLRIGLHRAFMGINHHEKPKDMESAILAGIDNGLKDTGDKGERSGVDEIREGQKTRNPWA